MAFDTDDTEKELTTLKGVGGSSSSRQPGLRRKPSPAVFMPGPFGSGLA